MARDPFIPSSWPLRTAQPCFALHVISISSRSFALHSSELTMMNRCQPTRASAASLRQGIIPPVTRPTHAHCFVVHRAGCCRCFLFPNVQFRLLGPNTQESIAHSCQRQTGQLLRLPTAQESRFPWSRLLTQEFLRSTRPKRGKSYPQFGDQGRATAWLTHCSRSPPQNRSLRAVRLIDM